MDEIESMKIVKKLIKSFMKLLIPAVIFGIIAGMLDENNIFNTILNIILAPIIEIEFILLIVIFNLFIYSVYTKICIFMNSKLNIVKNEDYTRDWELKYSPAIISLILDLQIVSFKDYTAMILYLCYRKYIDLYEENGEFKIKIINEEIQELNPHEQYVYRCVNGSGFSENKFEKLIIEDAVNLNLISIENGEIKRTSKGEQEAKLWKGIKNYIHDYTLISEKNIDHIELLNEYIPYAIALDEAKSIEKFVSENENYRNLIYRFYNEKKKGVNLKK